MYSLKCTTLYPVHLTLYPVHKTMHYENSHFTMYIKHCHTITLHIVLSTIQNLPCTLENVHCTLNNVHCTLNTVPCTLDCVHCTLHPAHYTGPLWALSLSDDNPRSSSSTCSILPTSGTVCFLIWKMSFELCKLFSVHWNCIVCTENYVAVTEKV